MGWEIAIATAVGAALSATATAVGSSVQGNQMQSNAQAAWAQGERQKKLMEYNARVEELNAHNIQEQARNAETRDRRENRRLMATQRANAAASGVTTAGSPLTVFGESAENAEISALDIRQRGEMLRDEHLYAADMYRYQGQQMSEYYDSVGDSYRDQANWAKGPGMAIGMTTSGLTTGLAMSTPALLNGAASSVIASQSAAQTASQSASLAAPQSIRNSDTVASYSKAGQSPWKSSSQDVDWDYMLFPF